MKRIISNSLLFCCFQTFVCSEVDQLLPRLGSVNSSVVFIHHEDDAFFSEFDVSYHCCEQKQRKALWEWFCNKEYKCFCSKPHPCFVHCLLWGGLASLCGVTALVLWLTRSQDEIGSGEGP